MVKHTTEVVTCPLVFDCSLEDPSNATYIAFKKAFDIVSRQDGFQESHLGMQIESPYTMEAMINWDSKEALEEWKTKPEYSTVNAELAPFKRGEGTTYHVDFEPYPDSIKVFKAPMIEAVRWYFEGKAPSDYMSSFLQLDAEVIKAKLPGYIALAAGLSHEEVEYEDVKGQVFVVLIGWESMDAHVEAKVGGMGNDIALKFVELIRSTAKTGEMHHVQFTMRHYKDGHETK